MKLCKKMRLLVGPRPVLKKLKTLPLWILLLIRAMAKRIEQPKLEIRFGWQKISTMRLQVVFATVILLNIVKI